MVAIDLDAERARRAAEREVSGESTPIVLGGKEVAYLPAELPLQALAPLRRLDEEITLLVRAAVDMWKEGTDQSRIDGASLIIDVLAANPKLPTTAIDVVQDMARALLGEEGFDALMAQSLSTNDLAYLANGILAAYGLSLGEASPSSGSPTEGGGPTSSTTSEPTSDSTPATLSAPPETPDSSEPVAS